MNVNRSEVAFLAVLFTALVPASLAVGQVGPSPYLSLADSPWSSQAFTYFHLEDFEDGVFDPPGADANGATSILTAGGTFTDSVDADDGAIDGSGTNGRSHYTTNGIQGITYSFDATELGGLPTHAGLVWTDLSGTADVFFEAFDASGLSLGVINAGPLNDGNSMGQTAEDRFLGWTDPGGILSIRIYQSASDLEVDHVQYGRVIPEPITASLLSLALLLISGSFRARA